MLNSIERLPAPILADLQSCFDHTEGMVSFEEALLLYQLAKEVKQGCIVEVGTYRGRSTVFLAKGSMAGSGSPIYAVDPHKSFVGVLGGIFGPKDRTAFFRAMLEHNCSEIVALINLSSESFSNSWKEQVSLLWIDGDHSDAGVRRDFECWKPHLGTGSVIAFDDATDTALGPSKLIDELIASTQYEFVFRVGKVAVIRRCVG